MGRLRTGNKSELMPCLENLVPVKEDLSTPRVQVNILDGAAIINMLRPGTAKTFQCYVTEVFVPYVTSQLQHVERLDFVWDLYIADSLKADTRNRRGKGVRRRVEPTSEVPRNWQEFLRIDDNKTELFSFLASNLADLETNKHLITTQGTGVLSSKCQDMSALAPCTHEEADTRIFLHLQNAVQHGYSKVSIRTVDTDVVVLAIASVNRLKIAELWIAFGAGKSFRFIAAHEIAKILGPERCVALPMFHAFTGCDTVSCFGGRGKKTAWDTWTSYGDVTAAFCALGAMPDPRAIEEWMQPLERFVVLLYDRTSTEVRYNSCEMSFFYVYFMFTTLRRHSHIFVKIHSYLLNDKYYLSNLSVCLSIYLGECESGKKAAVQQERQSYRWCASYTGSTYPAHQKSCIPGWSLLGPNDDPCSRASIAK